MVAADPPVSPVSGRPAGVADAIVSRSVLVAIDADPELRGVNLVVSVVDGVAVIGGPVPSQAIAKRLEDVVRKVPEIKEVRNGCFVASGPDPLMRAVAERLGSPANRSAMPELPGVLTAPKPPVWASPAPAGFQNPNTVALASPGNTVVVRKPSVLSSDGTGVLGAPVGSTGPGTPSPSVVRDPYAVPSTAPGKLTGTGGTTLSQAVISDILTAAGNVKRVEARFAHLTVELREGFLVIGGTAPRASDAWDLADKLRLIPGVERVVIATGSGKP
jgi:hypothetical protein